MTNNDAGYVSRNWLQDLAGLPSHVRSNLLVARLEELLTRQSQRGTAKHLADDLRELSARDADAAHDSLGLVRIIVWAIPMLGFLGTVIGITQTLGGLDFTNGSAAVDNLKSGLYVAFDTTALGLVLSVVAIFLQFPIERSEQRLLAEVDARVGHLVSASLPGEETADNQTALVAELCKGVQAAVAESLENQARLWRDTIDEAQDHWRTVHQQNQNDIAAAFTDTLIPALDRHASQLRTSSETAATKLEQQCDRWAEVLSTVQQAIEEGQSQNRQQLIEGLQSILIPALQDHSATLDETTQMSADRLQEQWENWQQALSHHADTMSTQQLSLSRQYDAQVTLQQQTISIVDLQRLLDKNLERLAETNEAVEQSVNAAAGDGMADAMRILARAVDVLSRRLADVNEAESTTPTRRAA